MGFAFLIVGIALAVASWRNTQGVLAGLLAEDMPGFVKWSAAIVAVGAIGFIPKARPAANAMLGLIFLAMILKNKGAFDGFISAFTKVTPASPAASDQTQPLTGKIPVAVSISKGGSSGGLDLGSMVSAGSTIAGFL